MKMSDEFTLPTAVESAVIVADDKYKAQFGGHMTPPSTANTTRSQNKSISHAVNNHDALVECLTETIKHTNHYGTCECCDVMVGPPGERETYPDDEWNPCNDHGFGCKVKIAQKLLESIK